MEFFKNSSKKIGYVRAYIDSYNRYWSTYFPVNEQLKTPEIRKEFNKKARMIFNSKVFKSFDNLCLFCSEYPSAADPDFENGYTFVIESQECGYLVRFLCRRGDYNCYLYCFLK